VRGRERLLGPVTLWVPAGATLALLGPSGAGKSTLLRAVNRLLPPGLTVQGEVVLGGVTVPDDPRLLPCLRRAAGMVLQRPAAFPGSVVENVALVRRAHGLPAEPRRVAAYLELAAVPRRLYGASAESLSGGELQRLALARTLALEPGLLLLDEPTAALDPLAARSVEEALLGLRRRVTIVWVTHSVAQAERIAERAAVLWDGRLLAEGSVPALRRAADERVRLLCR
jgi:ABC-type phosphate transport system ATPase subunit